MNTPAVVIDTVPLVDVVALYVSALLPGSVAVTVPTTAPVDAVGVPRVTLEITGGATVTAAALTGATAAADTTWPVDTDTAGTATVLAPPDWRRTAANTTHDTGDSTGTP